MAIYLDRPGKQSSGHDLQILRFRSRARARLMPL
jgi:hypothetical protein